MKLGSINPALGAKLRLINKVRKEEMEDDSLPTISEESTKPTRTTMQRNQSEISSMGYRKKSAAPLMKTMPNGGSRMRASDIKTGSRKRGAY